MVLFEDMIKEIPPITKLLCGSSILLQFLVYVNVLSEYDIYLNLTFIFSKFQIWRFYTNLLYFDNLGIITFFRLLMLYRCSKRLEEHTFKNKTADYLFFLLLGITVMTIYGSIFKFTSLSKSFLTMLLYLWSRYNRNVVLLLFGLIPMKAPYITWFFVLIDIVIGESIVEDILGIVIGHLYYFFYEIYPKLPQSQGSVVIKTPTLFTRFVGMLNLQHNQNIVPDDFAFDQPENNNFGLIKFIIVSNKLSRLYALCLVFLSAIAINSRPSLAIFSEQKLIPNKILKDLRTSQNLPPTVKIHRKHFRMIRWNPQLR